MSISDKSCLKTEMIVKMIRSGEYTIEELETMAKLPTLTDCLNEMIGRQNRPIDAIAGLAGMNTATFHKILSRKMNPSRNMLIRISRSLDMTFEETQILLKSGNCAALSGNRGRDLYLIDGIENKKGIADINDALTSHGYMDLSGRG
jgi:DNA-binding phage protein